MIFVEIVKYVPQSQYFPWIWIHVNSIELCDGHCNRHYEYKDE